MNSLQILDRLIGFETVSRDPNIGLIEFVRDFLRDCGVESRLYRSADGRKANLYATIGPPERGGVLLSGHTDVVPVDGQRWSSEPFRLTERAGRYYARGAADMKGFLACALRAAREASTRSLATPLHLAFSYDEEVGCLGVRSLIDDMMSWTHKPSICIVGEPTALRTAIGHKGKTAVRAVCHGRAAHSACPQQGINAIHLASDLIGKVRERQRDIERSGARDPGYEVPYTTLHVGVIRGGTALNIVPDRCELELEIRNLAADDPAGILGAIRGDAADVIAACGDPAGARVDFDLIQEYPGLDTPADAEIVGFVAALTGHRDTFKVGFGTEGGLFSERAGVPAVVCGPGSIDQAHKPDEFIAADQIERCDAMLSALLERLAL